MRRTRLRRCVYCGGRLCANAVTCLGHRDLLRLDPYYDEARPKVWKLAEVSR